MTDNLPDDDEAFCEGDTPLEEVDWDAVTRLQRLQDEALDADDVSMAMLGLLHELHGDDLQVL
jgi:hypothetical protein